MHLNLCLVLGLCAARTSCLPTTKDNTSHEDFAMAGVPFSGLQSKYNITDAQLARLNVSSLEKQVAHDDMIHVQRPEINSGQVCRWYYRVVMNRWIVQVPESWYMPKFTGPQDACNAWHTELDRSMPGAGVILQECGRREDGDIRGWLHIRFTTIIGIPGSSVEAVIGRMGDPKGMVSDPKQIICL